jgi:tripartite-type tricarboxylate transporter receptor subunit TctC
MRKLVLGFVLTCLSLQSVAQQPWPAKPVRLVAPFGTGGGVDLVARALGRRLSESWGQSVVVENRPGAAATIGANIVATAAPDGHTLLFTNNALAISAGLYPNLPYNTATDLTPISTVISTPFVFTVPASMKASSIAEFLSLAKSTPTPLTYSSSGIGSGPHLAMVLFTQTTGISLNHIPYKSVGLSIPDIIAGRIDSVLTTPLAAMPHVRTGKLRVLGVSSAARVPELPGVPTLIEAGIPGFDVETWYMALGPGKLPAALARKIQHDIADALKDPAVARVLEGDGATLVGSTPAQATELLARDIARWSKVIQQAGVKPSE